MNKGDFPILVKNPDLIYFDNAATTQKPYMVINSLVEFYENKNSNVHRGIYKLSESATEMYESSRKTVAAFINAYPNEIIFTSGTTLGINHIALLLEHNGILKSKDNILLSDMEHHSNILPWQRLSKKQDIGLDFIKITSEYELDLDDLTHKLSTQKPKIVSLTYISNVLGTVNPIEKIIKLIRHTHNDTIIIIDAAQAIAHTSIDVKSLDCDFLVFSGHKLYAPTGIGVIFGKQKILNNLEPIILGGGIVEKVTSTEVSFINSPQKFEAGTPNISGAIGLASAVNYINNLGWNKILNAEKELTQYTLEKLTKIPKLKLFGPKNIENRIGVFSFKFGSLHPHDLAQILDQSNICVRAGHHCCQMLHREILGIPASLRVSQSFYNESREVDEMCNKLDDAKELLS